MRLSPLTLVVALVLSIAIVCSAGRGRSSFRFSRSSYRARVSRVTSYRSFRSSSYNMAPGVLRRMGGIGINKKTLIAAGAVYIAYKMRPRFHGGFGYDIDDYAICEGDFTGYNSQNVSTKFRYFLCPTDYNYIIRWDDRKYCCGPPRQQRCCDKEEFYMQHGRLITGLSAAIIAVICVLSILFVCGCCGLLLYCKFRNSTSRDRNNQQATPVPTEDPAAAGKTSYPLQPQPQAWQGAPPYPQASQDVAYTPYPPPLPAGVGADAHGAAAPYPTYQPPPPAYPGPA